MHNFEKNLLTFLKSESELHSLMQGRVLFAVSGGIDSMVMLHAVYRLIHSGDMKSIIAVGHINHQLRDDANQDEALVQATAERLELPYQGCSVNVREYAAGHKHSIETAGRILRRRKLMDMADHFDCQVIATAHHADDNAETLIHRLSRGTGFRGLAGIRPAYTFDQITFIRPLLGVTRQEIESYCRKTNVLWHHDHTNDCLDYTRNVIRHQILPELRDKAPQVTSSLCRLASSAKRLDEQISRKVENLWPELCKLFDPETKSVSLHRDLYIKQPPWIQAALFQKVLECLTLGQRDVTSHHYQAVSICARDGGSIQLPGSLCLTTRQDALMFQIRIESKHTPVEEKDPVVLPLPGKIQYGIWNVETQVVSKKHCSIAAFLQTKDRFVEWFDLDRISGPLTLRLRKEGDRFVPLGQSSEKKVARFLIDAQLKKEQKRCCMIIEDDKKIIWVAPIRPSQKTRISDDTTRILQISLVQVKGA